jgi:hypothetical protein|tara:strand:+ start:131 stop:232 length:102 start_codon:yes stop_codon:yes gene_type:complete
MEPTVEELLDELFSTEEELQEELDELAFWEECH